MAVVILNWNSTEDTAAAIELLPSPWRERVLVVDNGSDDWQQVEARFRALGVMVERRAVNGGYAAGMNTGMRTARGLGYTHAALVNADARPDALSLERLADLAGDYAVLGTAQTGSRGVYVTAATGAGPFPKPFTCPGCTQGHHRVDVVSGATLVVDLRVMESVGHMEESYFHYAEEVDLCLKVARAGADVGWSCRTVVPHAGGGSLPHTSRAAHYYTSRNKILLLRMNGVRPWASPRLAKDQVVFARRAWRDGHLSAWARGLVAGLRGRGGRWEG